MKRYNDIGVKVSRFFKSFPITAEDEEYGIVYMAEGTANDMLRLMKDADAHGAVSAFCHKPVVRCGRRYTFMEQEKGGHCYYVVSRKVD